MERALAAVRRRIGEACARVGREPDEVALIGVTKGHPAVAVAMGADAGLVDFGENYVDELEAKRVAAPEARWHFIGRVQSNKAHRIARAADIVQTLEPGRAAGRLAVFGAERAAPVPGLVEVDLAGGRVGATPDQLESFVDELADEGWIEVRGLMTVAPLGKDPRGAFRALRGLRDRLRERHPGVVELSMGMSADMDAAVEEGATMVRVGSAIFGPRPMGGA